MSRKNHLGACGFWNRGNRKKSIKKVYGSKSKSKDNFQLLNFYSQLNFMELGKFWVGSNNRILLANSEAVIYYSQKSKKG